jgi:hypothetical protein
MMIRSPIAATCRSTFCEATRRRVAGRVQRRPQANKLVLTIVAKTEETRHSHSIVPGGFDVTS